jgi:hypothetical protein
MQLSTLGHASTLLTLDNGQPLFISDPWLVGSTYWRSWWLQHYPSSEEIKSLQSVQYVYLTHEHPDHFHPPSLRKIGTQPTFLCPELPHMSMAEYLSSEQFKTKVLAPNRWIAIHEHCSILSMPLWNDDSILLILTPEAFIVNLNDAKPNAKIIRQINQVRAQLGNRTTIVLSSYSPAGIVNSFIKNGVRLSLRDKVDYVNYLNRINTNLNADLFIPFASQVIFLRRDSKWANEYKVTFDDLEAHWNCQTKLMRPYSKIDLKTGTISFVAPDDYCCNAKVAVIEQREQEEEGATLELKHLALLQKKLNSSRYLYAILFPKGVGFEVNEQYYHYSAIRGRVIQCQRSRLEQAHFSVKVPAQTLKEALENEHLGDIGISMFIEVSLHSKINLKLIYIFFMLITIHDYKHNRSVSEFIQWMTSTVWQTMFRSPRIPLPSL